MAEGAIERLGDMLRYTLKEDGRELVDFSEEYDFTRQYLAFEHLRYEDRLKIDVQIDADSFNFDIPPFSMQTLAENAVHRAISVRPEGGSIWIRCSCHDGRLTLSVCDLPMGIQPMYACRVHRRVSKPVLMFLLQGRPSRENRPKQNDERFRFDCR